MNERPAEKAPPNRLLTYLKVLQRPGSAGPLLGVWRRKVVSLFADGSRVELDGSRWADKTAALASYARQSEDRALLQLAVRIQARAIKRCGELLKTFSKGDGRPKKKR